MSIYTTVAKNNPRFIPVEDPRKQYLQALFAARRGLDITALFPNLKPDEVLEIQLLAVGASRLIEASRNTTRGGELSGEN